MYRLILAFCAMLLLAGCASTTHYHRDLGGADYYYGDSSYADYYGPNYTRVRTSWGGLHGWYPSYVPVAVCSPSLWFPGTNCFGTGWTSIGIGLGSGWAWNNVRLGFGYGSPWYGFGGWGFSGWGYPGFYDPWFSPWWPYPVAIYDPHRGKHRYANRLRHEQAHQAGWRRNGSLPASAAALGSLRAPGVVHRQPASSRRTVVRRRAAGHQPNHHRPRETAPRGRPQQRGIPVDWLDARSDPNRGVRPRPMDRPDRPLRPRPVGPSKPSISLDRTRVQRFDQPIQPRRTHAAPASQRQTPVLRQSRPSTVHRQPVRTAPRPTTIHRPKPAPRPVIRSAPVRHSAPAVQRSTPRGRPVKRRD